MTTYRPIFTGGSSGVPFVPIDIPGLVLWTDATDINGNGTTTPNGTAIATWVDKSSAGNNATQATGAAQPITVSNAQGGLTALNFNGADYMQLSANITGNTNTIFIVTVPTIDTANVQTAVVTDANSLYASLGVLTTPSGQWGSFVSVVVPDGVLTSSSAYVLGIVPYAANNIALSLNGVVTNNTDGIAFVPRGASYIGAGTPSTQVINGYICEILVYSVAITTAQITVVNQYLMQKWGVT